MSIPGEGIIINIDSIINETLDNLLTRKADYILILKYATFLVEIGRIDKAITRLQIYNFDPRFMNNGEILFYKGLFEFIKLENEKIDNDKFNISNYNSFLLNFNKCIGLIKNSEIFYMDWILNFLQRNCMINELNQFLQNEKLKTLIEFSYPKKFDIYKLLIDSDHSDENLRNKIFTLSEELENNITDIYYFYKLFDLIKNFYEENNDPNYNQSTFIYKFAHLGPNILISVVKFLSNFTLLDDIENRKKNNINDHLIIAHNIDKSNFHKEEFLNLNYLYENILDDKYLDIFHEILLDLKNYFFWTNHKNIIDKAKLSNHIPLNIDSEEERQIYVDNYFILKDKIDMDLIKLKSILWDLFKNLIMQKFKVDFVRLLKKILKEFQIFIKDIWKKNTNYVKLNIIANLFLKEYYDYQITKVERNYRILNIVNEIIFYKGIQIQDKHYINFDLLRKNLLYSLEIIKNFKNLIVY